MNKEDLTEALIHALENSQQGFDAFKVSFEECASAFEVGEDAKGLSIITGLIKPLQDLSKFCADMIGTHSDILEEGLFNTLTEQCETFENLLTDLITEMEDGNLVEVGDILKYDMGDLIANMSKTFPEIAESLKQTA